MLDFLPPPPGVLFSLFGSLVFFDRVITVFAVFFSFFSTKPKWSKIDPFTLVTTRRPSFSRDSPRSPNRVSSPPLSHLISGTRTPPHLPLLPCPVCVFFRLPLPRRVGPPQPLGFVVPVSFFFPPSRSDHTARRLLVPAAHRIFFFFGTMSSLDSDLPLFPRFRVELAVSDQLLFSFLGHNTSPPVIDAREVTFLSTCLVFFLCVFLAFWVFCFLDVTGAGCVQPTLPFRPFFGACPLCASKFRFLPSTCLVDFFLRQPVASVDDPLCHCFVSLLRLFFPLPPCCPLHPRWALTIAFSQFKTLVLEGFAEGPLLWCLSPIQLASRFNRVLLLLGCCPPRFFRLSTHRCRSAVLRWP